MPKTEIIDASGEVTLKSVIIYDDLAFVAKASAILQRVGNRTDVAANWTTTSWPISALQRAGTMNRSILEAADAHLIVIPTPLVRALSSQLGEWLERWAAVRQIQDAALAVINDGNHGFTNAASPELTKLVQKLGLNLILDERPVARETTKPGVRFPRAHELPSAVQLRHVDHTVRRNSFRSFGINE
jgi:hypothetical protein